MLNIGGKVTMVTETDVEKYFQEVKWIHDTNLQKKVITVWKKASEQGHWQHLEDVPFTLLFPNSGCLVDHTKRITKLAKTIAEAREETLDRDALIAGALLHDVGKLLEYEFHNGTIVKSELGKTLRHPISGANLAKECGIPDAVVHIIAAHSHEGDTMDRTPEAIIVHHCDFIDFEIKKREQSVT